MSAYGDRRELEPVGARFPQVWGKETPSRNPHFTGRRDELAALEVRLIAPADVAASRPPQPIVGLGGVGKTELATEYVYQFGSSYELIWWIRADTDEKIRIALVRLGQKLGLSASPDYDETITAVRNALVQGTPHTKWLLVFDNVSDPACIATYVPATTPYGHVIMTSQVKNWDRYTRAEPIEVGEFREEESLTFLRQRAKALAPFEDLANDRDAEREVAALLLARTLGHLPLAEEHAVAYLNETNASVAEYLGQFKANAHRLFSSEADLGYPRSVATAWSVSIGALPPGALALFQLCAFFPRKR